MTTSTVCYLSSTAAPVACSRRRRRAMVMDPDQEVNFDQGDVSLTMEDRWWYLTQKETENVWIFIIVRRIRSWMLNPLRTELSEIRGSCYTGRPWRLPPPPPPTLPRCPWRLSTALPQVTFTSGLTDDDNVPIFQDLPSVSADNLLKSYLLSLYLNMQLFDQIQLL